MRKVIKKLTDFEIYVLAVLFVAMVIAIFLQIINRLYIQTTMSWTEELARYCMIAVAMIGAEIGLRTGVQMSITMFTDKLPVNVQKLIDIFATLVCIVFCSVVCYSSLTIIEKQLSSTQTSPAMGLPMWVPYMAVTLAMGIMALTHIFKLAILVKDFGKHETTQTIAKGV